MGWNEGWSIMEEQTMNLHEAGLLTQPVLKIVMRPFYGTDVDEGGSSYPTSSDGKSFYQIVVETMLPDFKFDPDFKDDDQYGFSDQYVKKFYEILRTRSYWFDS